MEGILLFLTFYIDFLGVPLKKGRALRCNLFARSSQKGFPLQSLTQGSFLIK